MTADKDTRIGLFGATRRDAPTVTSQRFTATVVAAPRGHILIPVPFDPDAVWGTRSRHLISGTVDGLRVRGALDATADGYGFALGPAWLRDRGLAAGDTVTVQIEPEGPQRGDLADDIATALDANPQAGAFFDSLAQFYRRAYLRWIDATKRRPEQRPLRIAEMIRLLETGHKQRP
jgi:hypothetical protein